MRRTIGEAIVFMASVDALLVTKSRFDHKAFVLYYEGLCFLLECQACTSSVDAR